MELFGREPEALTPWISSSTIMFASKVAMHAIQHTAVAKPTRTEVKRTNRETATNTSVEVAGGPKKNPIS